MGIAITLAQHLLDREVAYDVVPRPDGAGSEASAVSTVAPDNVVEAIVLNGRDGFMLVLRPASRRIQFHELQRLLGGAVSLANEEQVETLFPDCDPGSVTAVGAAYGLSVVIDDSLARQADLNMASGDPAHLIHISGASFRRLMENAPHGTFTRRA